ncbi:Epoxide hydrolase A-like protein [Drosera capensis]
MASLFNDIQHDFIAVRGLKLHVASIGDEAGPAVLFLHGFPEIWYTWRHQMIAVSKAGHRAIAPDFRGYGLSDKPAEPEKTTYADLVDDLVELLDRLGLDKVFLVAKDFGVRPAYLFVLLHPERVIAIVTLGIPHLPLRSTAFLESLPEGFYISRWQKPGRAEADFGRLEAKTVVRNIYILFSRSEIPIAKEGQEIMDMVEPNTPLPAWFSEEDLAVYGELYEKSGFETALQVPYRSLGERFDIEDPVVKVPALLIIGNEDYVYKFPGIKEYVESGMVKELVPDLEVVYLPDGTHFVHEQLPDKVNKLLVKFLDGVDKRT